MVRPSFGVSRNSLSGYKLCGYFGFLLAILMTVTLLYHLGFSPWVMTGIIAVAALTFLALAMTTKIITGEEQLIYYHHQIAVMIAVALFLRITGQPLLPYLDVLILGIGTFLVCGRLGCLMVGCCHGKPYKWGVRYLKEHAEAGFTDYYVGIRLFPVQAVESLWVLLVVVVGCVFILTGSTPGEILAWYIIAYGAGRFCFEFLRGDPDRPYLGGFSEAQWTSVLLMGGVAWAELSGSLVLHTWHIAATAAVVATMIAVALTRYLRRTHRHRLLNPHHIREIAQALEQASSTSAGPNTVPVCCTSQGIQISAGRIESVGRSIEHYSLSSRNETMTEANAGVIANLIVQLRHIAGAKELVTQNRGVFHLLIHPQTAGGGK